MFQKLLLAVTITFCLNLFLKVHLPNTSTTASNFPEAKTSKLIRLLEQGLSRNLHLFLFRE